MTFDHERRAQVFARLRQRQILDEAALSPTERLQRAEELLALAWSLHGPPPEEPWSLLAARRAKRNR
ncbi:MAG: hypothetical protein KIT84_40240 [Labilithrix sp.]|nr:hypothetical protein [Labilithrix sp.]MCW5817297.1 hypothetical protein [Labilithrix sp.]